MTLLFDDTTQPPPEARMRYCPRCDNCRWVCEAHPDKPWEGPRACGCGAPGDPRPVCNWIDTERESRAAGRSYRRRAPRA